MRLLGFYAMLAFSVVPAVAGSTGVVGAEEALRRGDAQSAVRLLREALQDGDVKKREQALANVLLGEALLSRADAAAYAGESGPALRDLRLDALGAGHQALGEAPSADLAFRAEAIVSRARSLLWDQGHATAHASGGSSVKWWVRGLEAREGESLESLSLMAMDQVSAGNRAAAARSFEAALSTADQEGSAIRTPRWGLTYADAAANLLAQRPDGTADAIALLERGLAWQARASTELGSEHELAVAEVESHLQEARLNLLIALPERRAEALYAVEARLRERPRDLALLSRLAPWLETHFPDRALNAYVNAQAARPQDGTPSLLAGKMLLGQAEAIGRERRSTADRERRGALARQRQGKLQDARQHLERAEALGTGGREVIAALAKVCADLGDRASADAWRARIAD